MSGLETLPPDQRAVLQLILVQGRGYADLATTLRLDAAAVRERAHAAAQALGAPPGGELAADARGRIVDYLLGQQDEGERIVTFAELGDSVVACRWAQALREQLADLARGELPEVPAAAAATVALGNGSVANGAGAATVAPAPAAVARPTPPAATPSPAAATPPAPPRSPARRGPSGPDGPRPSRLGGAILIAGAAALAIVLAIVLIGGGGGNGGSGNASSTSGAGPQASARTATAPSAAGTSTGTSRAPSARLIGQALLRPPAGGGAAGGALVEQISDGRRAIAVVATRLQPNGAQDIYAIWLQGTAGARFLGFVPRRVGSDGQFTVSSSLPRGLDLPAYANVLVTREGTSAVPSTPGPTVLSGPLRLTG